MKKTAIILTLGAFAIIAVLLLWLYRSSDVPDHSKRDPILFPPHPNWPPEVTTAISRFRELKGKWRNDQVIPIAMFAYRMEHNRQNSAIAPHSSPLSKKDVLQLFGPPDYNESKYSWEYLVARSEWSSEYLTIFFNRGEVSFIGGGAGLCARKVTADELMMPPEENETESGKGE